MSIASIPSIRLASFALVAVATLAACGSTASGQSGVATLPSADPGVATLSSAEPSAAETATPSTDPADAQEAFLEFAECMRENGIDMPDPQIDPDGGFRIGGPAGAGDRLDFESEEFEAAQEVCGDLLEGLAPDIDPQERAERQEALVDFARCMRENGIDMPDPQFGDGPGMTVMIGGADSEFDPESPEFQAASETCQPLLGDGPFGRGAP